MKIFIENCSFNEKLLRETVRWALKTLGLTKKHLADVEIHIKFHPDLMDKTQNVACVGVCDEEYTVFEMDVDGTPNLIYKISMILHELIHVKQFILGELQYPQYKEGGSLWRRKFISDSERELDLPWEVEAYGKEKILLRMWREHFKKKYPKLIDLIDDRRTHSKIFE